MLKNSLKFLIKDTAIYGFAGALTKFIAIFTLPIIARILSKDEFGILNTVIAITAAFSGFITLGQDSSVARWFYDKEGNDIEYRKQIVSTGFFIQILSTILFSIVLLLFHDKIGKVIFNNNITLIHYWKIYIFSIPASAFLLFSNNLFKWTFKKNKYLILTLGNSLFSISLTIILLVVFKLSLFGAIIAPVISVNIFSVIGVFMARKYISIKKIGNNKLILEMLKYGLPFGVIIIIGTLMPSIDRIFLIRYVDMATIGEYSVSLKIAGLMLMVISAFGISFGPYAYSIWKKPEAPRLFGELLIMYFALLLFMGTTISVFGVFLIDLFAGEKYNQAILVLPFLLIAFAIKGLVEFSLLGISWSKKTYYNIFATLLQFVTLIVCSFFLIERYKVMGAVISILISNIIYILYTFFISNKYYKINIQINKVLFLLSFATIVHVFVILDFKINNNLFTTFHYLSYLCFIVFSFFIVFNAKQRQYIKKKLFYN